MGYSPFLGEIMLCSWNYPPKGWAFCNGQLLPINQNQPLFSLLGTTYGGDGRVNFALPDLRSRVPAHFGSGLTQGQALGQEAHTITISEMPAHVHLVNAANINGTTVLPGSDYLAQFAGGYGGPSDLVTLDPASITNTGGSQPHENRQPYLTINFAIALIGVFPSRN
jgi:microcystin-dependent protein